ncbi:MAG: 2-C-methyl-D-erythritol 4-phosphate cytidylyltransferase [candidate division Zixibacteria bacterium]|nr:2-C-methyl-D-erythritol 4-phosphate cytidylyltransferase [candidate division Zixibacteria bacterium]
MKNRALIVAAGSSERFGGDVPKQYREVAGRPLLAWTISRFEAARLIDEIVLVVAEDYLLFVSERVVDPFGFRKVTKIVPGGDTRQESVRLGLERMPISTALVAIHDGARPLVTPADIDRVIEVAATDRAALLVQSVTDTVKRVEQGFVLATLDRKVLCQAQTPQVFQYDLIRKAHEDARESGESATDDTALIERRGFKVRAVESSSINLKVTTPEDLLIARAFIEGEPG